MRTLWPSPLPQSFHDQESRDGPHQDDRLRMHSALPRPQQDQHRSSHGDGKEDPVHRSENEANSEEVPGNRVPGNVERAEEITHRQTLRQTPDHRSSPGQHEEVALEQG